MATKLEFLVAKFKVLVALATVSVAISSPALEGVLKYVEAKNSGKRSTQCLTQSQKGNAKRNQYCKAKQFELKHRKPAEKDEECL